MSFIDDSEQNMEKYVSSLKEENKSVPLLKEVTGGSVGGFVGGAGYGGFSDAGYQPADAADYPSTFNN